MLAVVIQPWTALEVRRVVTTDQVDTVLKLSFAGISG